MEEAILYIEGLPKADLLELESYLSKSDTPIVCYVESNNTVRTAGKYNEFVSTSIICIAITKIALEIIKLWLEKRSIPKKMIQGMTIKLSDNKSIRISEGKVKITEGDNTIIEIALDADSHDEKGILKYAGSFSKILEPVLDLFKSLKE